ncbi:MAG: protein phosphatase 2C domain-containing protein [Deltaproteobacteria bacterium]|nr:protein phosphatase 2C domain-containing protein [Deltaproteobacteria bacterium]
MGTADTGFLARFQDNISLLSHKGRRKTNEDSIEICEFEAGGKKIILAAIADGMGGHLSGEVASQIAAKGFVDHVEQSLKKSLEPENIKVAIFEAYKAVNQQIIAKSRKDAAAGDMGSTLTAAIIIGTEYLISNLGDSRAYRIPKDDIVQVSQDHSAGAESLRDGLINEIEAKGNRYANTLTRFLGSEDAFMPDIYPEQGFFKTSLGEILLLCTDGVSGVLDEISIYEQVAEAPDIGKAAQKLVLSAYRKGSLDNMSVILIEPLSQTRVQLTTPVRNSIKQGQQKAKRKRFPFRPDGTSSAPNIGAQSGETPAEVRPKSSVSEKIGQNAAVSISIEQQDGTLLWRTIREHENARDFEVSFFGSGKTGALIYSEHLQKNVLVIDATLKKRLKPNTPVYWQVSCGVGNQKVYSERKEFIWQDQ